MKEEELKIFAREYIGGEKGLEGLYLFYINK